MNQFQAQNDTRKHKFCPTNSRKNQFIALELDAIKINQIQDLKFSFFYQIATKITDRFSTAKGNYFYINLFFLSFL